MRIINTKRFVTGVLILIGIVMMLSSTIFVEESSNKEVDCYDKYSNKIIGERCIDESSLILTEEGEILLLIGVVIFFFSLFTRLIGEDYSGTNYFGMD